MKPVPITLRLAASFCLLAAVLFVVGWQGISRLRRLNAQLQNGIYKTWKEEQLSHEAFRLSFQNSQITLLIFLMDDPEKVQRLLIQHDVNTQRITGLVQVIKPLVDTEREKRLFAVVEETRTHYIESYQRALSLLLGEHKPDEARKMMVDSVLPNLAAYHTAWGAFDQQEVDEIEQVMRQSKTDFAADQRDLLLLLTLAGLLTAGIAIFSVVRMGREVDIRRHAEESLRQANDRLEQHVQERTSDLGKANEALRSENAERKRAEETLRESEGKFRQLAENITDVFWMTSPDLQQIHYVSPAYEQVWGRSAQNSYTNPREWAEAILPEERERVFVTFLKLARESSVSTEFQIARPDGTVRWIYSRGFQVRDALGNVIRLAGVATDITERKQPEAQLFQSQKMETVGKLAGGIAHEFNSILTAIIGRSELLLGDLPAGSPDFANAVAIRKAADLAAALTKQLLAYGRKQILRPESLNLNQILTAMEGMLRHLMGSDVDVLVVTADGLPVVKADTGQIEQVIMNIAINAREAMPHGGKLTLETSLTTLDEEYVRHFPEVKSGDYVMLAISDTGEGMSEEVKAHLFEPFFTTKRVGEGTGLGLATCHGIIKQSGGHINVYSEIGRGTTFKIYLPEAETQAEVATARPAPHELPAGTETILLVEDDTSLRTMATLLLQRLGYSVLVAANGPEALTLARQRDMEHIDLLFTDIVMPQMDGKGLSDRIIAIHPNTKVLFTSAYTETAIVHQGVLDPGVSLLQKPFTPSALALKVRELLDA